MHYVFSAIFEDMHLKNSGEMILPVLVQKSRESNGRLKSEKRDVVAEPIISLEQEKYKLHHIDGIFIKLSSLSQLTC